MNTSHRVALVLFAASSCACGALAQSVPGGAVQPVVVHAIAHFEFDRTTVLPADQQALLAEVATMKDVTGQTVSAQGYADNIGAPDYNRRLSARRATAVRAFLLHKGLDPNMVSAAGKGVADPIADNATADGRAMNRRTEVTFQGVRAASASPR